MNDGLAAVTESDLCRRIRTHLDVIYPDAETGELSARMIRAMGLNPDSEAPDPSANKWDEKDIIAITYGDTISRDGEVPLRTLHGFFNRRFADLINIIHLLPFFPYSSDDGFAIINYVAVNDGLGDWDDVTRIAGDYHLMADLVINHCSSRSLWFENYRQQRDPGSQYFFEGDPDMDLSDVVRPRTSPLLREVDTPAGKKHVWCTFSQDQVDLNFQNPEVLLEFVRIIRFYMNKGVRLFRFDAIAFLWKVPGTHCINLPQTHEIVRLLRTLIEHHDDSAIIITETNLPNHENLSYFGNGNEAHMVYNFPLPPLLLNTMVTGDCTHLKTWMMSMPPSRNGTTYLNFIASHDGIGLRPAEGLLSEDEIRMLIIAMEKFGGRTSWRIMPNRQKQPYEINISLFDALQGTVTGGADKWQLQRMLCAHAILLALEGIPALYIHSLLGTQNDLRRLNSSGQNRAINRHKWNADRLDAALDDSYTHNSAVFRGLSRLIAIRRQQTAFHPSATQFTLHLGSAVFGFWRQSNDHSQNIFALHNITAEIQHVSLADINLTNTDDWIDLVTENRLGDIDGVLEMTPYQVVWLSNQVRTTVL